MEKMGMFKQIVMVVFVLALVWPVAARAAANPDALYRQGRYTEAEKAYGHAAVDHPRDLRYRYNRGCAAFQNGDFSQAAAAFTSVLRRSQDDGMRFKAAYNLGNAAFKQNDLVSARAAYTEALRLNPDSPEARHNLEMTLRAIQKSEQEKAGQKPEQKEGSGESPDQDQTGKSGDKGDKSQGQQGEKGREGQKQDAPPSENQGENQDAQKKAKPTDRAGQIQGPSGQPEGETDRSGEERAAAALDRQKAEALLDNIHEDRSRFLEYQLRGGKKAGGRSGKDW